jgi:uncharacterized repeat protein (TIGR03803 family)
MTSRISELRPPPQVRLSIIVSALAVFALAGPAAKGDPVYKMVYSFGQSGDGQLPYGALTADANGVLYGTTSSGGSFHSGTVFSLTPPAIPGGFWTETQLLSFDGAGGGAHPLAGVVFGANGALCGTTSAGGASGAGVVFSLAPPAIAGGSWTETVLYNFAGSPDGSAPGYGALAIADGGLYGTTTAGGAHGAGTVFALLPPSGSSAEWTESVLWSFGGASTDGTYPEGGLVQGAGGVFYGGASGGGTNGQGAVFSMTPPAAGLGGAWTETVLYSFQGEADGTAPEGSMAIGPGGVLYGATSLGGGTNNEGTVFSLTPPAAPGRAWQEEIIYRFSEIGTRQYYPRSGVVGSNRTGTLMLFAAASEGGLGPDGGLNSFTAPDVPGKNWAHGTLSHFIGTNGNNPVGGLLVVDNILYGTTYSGGEQNFGVVYELKLQ